MAFVDIPFVRTWSIALSGETERYGHSDNSGYLDAKSGTNDWTATVVSNLTKAGVTITVGDDFTLHFYQDGTLFWSGVILVESIDISSDSDSGNTVQVTYNVGGHGALTNVTGATTAPLSSVNGNVQWEVVA